LKAGAYAWNTLWCGNWLSQEYCGLGWAADWTAGKKMAGGLQMDRR